MKLVQNRDGVGPYGAKGGGEGAVNPISPCIANALYQATGVRMRTLPLDARARLESAAGEKRPARRSSRNLPAARISGRENSHYDHTQPFRNSSARQRAEASQMLAHYGDDAGIYAGGTELLLAMKHSRFELSAT